MYQYSAYHADIESWVESVNPTREDFESRQMFYMQIHQLISQNWRKTFSLEIFGSSKTGLLLPGSDLDLVIFEKSPENPKKFMQILTRVFQRSGLFKSVFFIRQAKVPIIKIQHKNSLSADISCNITDGVEGSNFISQSMTRIPSFRPLVLVIKRLLAIYGLNDASNGGLGSFALSVMVLAYITNVHPNTYDLGEILLGFLHFYGERFNEKTQAISALVLGGLAPRPQKFERSELVVENPVKRDHNAAAACSKWSMIASLFKSARYTLTSHDPRFFVPPQFIRPGDFSPFPFLSAFHNLKGSGHQPVSIMDKLSGAYHSVVEKIRPVKNKEIIDIDNESIPGPAKKRKRGVDEETSKKRAHIDNTRQSSASTPLSTNTQFSTPNNNNNEIKFSNNSACTDNDNTSLNDSTATVRTISNAASTLAVNKKGTTKNMTKLFNSLKSRGSTNFCAICKISTGNSHQTHLRSPAHIASARKFGVFV